MNKVSKCNIFHTTLQYFNEYVRLTFEKMSVTLTDMDDLSRTQQATRENILEAAIALMSERGFHRVSVQEIGKKAGICEKTVFRYFPAKTDLLTGIIRYRAYAEELKLRFEKQCTWDLAHDLHLAAQLFLTVTKKKWHAFRAYLSALDSIDTNSEDFRQNSLATQEMLSQYLEEMKQQGKVRDNGDTTEMARSFTNILHGYNLMYCLNDNEARWKTLLVSLNKTIDLFVRDFSATNIYE